MSRRRTESPTMVDSTTKESNRMAGKALDATTIAALLSKQKSRGDYDQELAEFAASGEAGIEVSLTEGRFTGKAAKMVKTGLDNARKRTGPNGLVHPNAQGVKCVIDEGQVYLINTAVGASDAE